MKKSHYNRKLFKPFKLGKNLVATMLEFGWHKKEFALLPFIRINTNKSMFDKFAIHISIGWLSFFFGIYVRVNKCNEYLQRENNHKDFLDASTMALMASHGWFQTFIPRDASYIPKERLHKDDGFRLDSPTDKFIRVANKGGEL